MAQASATMTQVAEEVGVSVATVSRLFNKDPELRISDVRRRQILDTAKRLGGVKPRGSQVRKSSRPRRRRTKNIVFPVNRQFSQQWVQRYLVNSEMMRHLEQALAVQKFHLQISFFDPGEEYTFVESIVHSGAHCDGMVFGSGMATAQLAELMQKHRFPHVTSDYSAQRFDVNTVRAHTSLGMRRAVEHLIELGHRRVAYFGDRQMYRYPHFVGALAEMGLDNDDAMHCFCINPDSTMDLSKLTQQVKGAFGNWLDDGPSATAVICSNDRWALAAIQTLRERGLVPGRDMSLVGHDNLEERGGLAEGKPEITTIDNPFDLIGKRMGELLLNQILHGQHQVVHERIPVPLIVRNTTGPCSEK